MILAINTTTTNPKCQSPFIFIYCVVGCTHKGYKIKHTLPLFLYTLFSVFTLYPSLYLLSPSLPTFSLSLLLPSFSLSSFCAFRDHHPQSDTRRNAGMALEGTRGFLFEKIGWGVRRRVAVLRLPRGCGLLFFVVRQAARQGQKTRKPLFYAGFSGSRGAR